jgi:hypothetical protein
MHSVCSAKSTKTIKTEIAKHECIKQYLKIGQTIDNWEGTEWNGSFRENNEHLLQ